MGYILDTNAVIYYLNASLPLAGMEMLSAIVDKESIVSVITKMETLGFNFKSIEEQNTMEFFIYGSIVLDISNDIVSKTIAIRKSKKIGLPDAIIAATAILYGLVLVTHNISEFNNIQGLNVVDPHNL